MSEMRRGYDTYEAIGLGKISVVVSERGVEGIFLDENNFKVYRADYPEMKEDQALCAPVIKQLDEYFKGKRKYFDLEYYQEGTPFRKKVWECLRRIPYGETVSYSEVAQHIGHPKAVRAVGAANKANQLPLIIPCHRVIGKNGKMVGFMGDKVSVKEKLLNHEKHFKIQL